MQRTLEPMDGDAVTPNKKVAQPAPSPPKKELYTGHLKIFAVIFDLLAGLITIINRQLAYISINHNELI